jgi:hypothetical protein
MEWSDSRPVPLYHRERAPGTHLIVRWVGLSAGLVAVEKRKNLVTVGNRTRVIQPVAIPTELSWLPIFFGLQFK